MPETAPTTRGEIAALASAARHYADHGRLEEARDVYAGLIELAPEVSYLHTGLGCVLVRLGCAGEALACFRTALQLDPEDVAALAYAGELSVEQGGREPVGLARPRHPPARRRGGVGERRIVVPEDPRRVGDLQPGANEPGFVRHAAARSVDGDAMPALAALLAAPAGRFREELDAFAARLREEESGDVRHALQTASQVLLELRRREEKP